MAKVTPSKRGKSEREQVVVKTKTQKTDGSYKWWQASDQDLLDQVLSTVNFLKTQQNHRHRQAAIYARMYGNQPLYSPAGGTQLKMPGADKLPIDRPTMNVVQACIDTLVSRITQSRPRPVFLTDNGNYKERNMAKKLNNFIAGELYQSKAYPLGELLLRDAAVLGTGCVKIYSKDEKVALERVLLTELLVDPNDAQYGDPRQLHQLKLVDRSVLAEMLPEEKSIIQQAEQAYPDNTSDAQKTAADQIMVSESWHLPSGKDAGDGRHVIACTSGIILDETFEKDKFPFGFLHFSPRLTGFWGQGLCEQLMGTQIEINKLLHTISKSINLVGVPRVFVEDGSKITKSHLNNEVGAIVTYRGTPPSYQVAPCVPEEVYAQLQRLIQFAFQQSGVSALAASAQKPSGLNSGEAIRNYDDLQSDRFAALSKRYDNHYVDLSYQIIDLAKQIAEETGSYTTVYPNKNGTKEVDLPKTDMLKDTYVIQCFDASALPRDPSGRLEKVTEMMQAGLVDPQEGRRMLDFPDIEQVDKLASASEERILQILDDIVDSGKPGIADPFMDLSLATKLVTQYYNLYASAKLEEKKQQQLRDFFSSIQAMQAAAMPQPQGPTPNAPQAVPTAPPVSQLIPNVPQGAA